MKKNKKTMILTHKLEGISKKVFDKHKKIIIEYIGKKSGVYALYDEKELYYVGRASDLAKRVHRHLKDRHSSLWTHFSVYFTKEEKYVNDLEAIIISIAWPKGNKVRPKLGKELKIKKLIKKAIEASYKNELKELGFGRKKRDNSTKKKSRPNLKGYFEKRRTLMKIYKGKEYKATLLKSGQIKYNNKKYDSPSAAAMEIVKKHSRKSAVSGWKFWFVQDLENNWIRLMDLD